MKKLKVFLSLFITLLLFFVSFVSVDVIASENNAYLITTNPAENSNIAMNISWHCDVDTEKYVEYTVATDTEFTNSKKQVGVPELETIYNSSVGGNSTSYRFRAQLYGLTEDTQYIYRIVGKTKSEVEETQNTEEIPEDKAQQNIPENNKQFDQESEQLLNKIKQDPSRLLRYRLYQQYIRKPQ